MATSSRRAAAVEAKGLVAAAAIGGSATQIATAAADKIVRIWNVADGKLSTEIPVDQAVIAVRRQDGHSSS